MRDVFEEGCHVGPVRASEMSLSLWPNECFRAVLIRDAALKQHLEGYWRRETHHVYAPDLVGVWVNTSSCSCVLDTSSADTSLAPGTGLQCSFQPSFLFINSEMTDRGWSLI